LKNGRCPSRTSLALCSNTAAIWGNILRPSLGCEYIRVRSKM
jgi:hypothetical protein